jgi:hypothetical protein
MTYFRRILVVGLACLLSTHLFAATITLHGVKLPDSTEVAGSTLQLNGAGTRYKAIFKVYVAGLYLGKAASTAEDVVGQPGPKRLSVTMLRSIDATELGKLLTRGMQDNMDKAAMSKLIPGLIRMGEIFASHKTLDEGDTFQIDWLPGTGSIITVKGQPQGEAFKEPEFFKALMMIWLGPVPADHKLKDALLGMK